MVHTDLYSAYYFVYYFVIISLWAQQIFLFVL